MKKLLVTLLLTAGFVTVASAGPLACANNTTNQCCIDMINIGTAAAQAPNHGIITQDGISVTSLSGVLTNDGTDGTGCLDIADYVTSTQPYGQGLFGWQAGNWAKTIAAAKEPLDCTANPQNQCCIDVANIQNAINQSHSLMPLPGNIHLANLSTTLVNDGVPAAASSCIANGVYLDASWSRQTGEFTWLPANWQGSIKYYAPSSAK